MAETDTETAVHIEPHSPDEVPLSVVREILSVALFDNGATAITQTPTGSMLAGFTSRRVAETAVTAITAAHGQLVTDIQVATDSHYDWSSSQRGGFTPTRVGRWLIRTPWTPPAEDVDARFDIQIDPVEAFGHGGHPSTKLAIQLLSPHLDTGMTVIDIGTGTGVLAIIAARVGARVLAIDHSAAAISAAENNIALNSAGDFAYVADQIELIHGDLDELDFASPALVVANLTIDVQSQLGPRLQRAPRLIASGVLGDQVGRLRDLYPSHGAEKISSEGEWAAVDFLAEPPQPRTRRA